MSTDIAFSDYLELRNLAYEWALSYDTKDWERLRVILAPSIRLDLSTVGGPVHESLTPDEYITIHQGVIGDKRLQTQHFIGASKYERLEDGTITASLQLRVAHQRYTDETLVKVANKGHAHGLNQQWYKKVDGKWKIAAAAADIHWTEYDLLGTLNPEGEAPIRAT